MPLGLKNNIINQKGTPAFYSDIFANRPTYGYAGRVFISTDTGAIYEDTGTSWTLIADAGAGTTGTLEQVTTNGKTTTQGISITGSTLNFDASGVSANPITMIYNTSVNRLLTPVVRLYGNTSITSNYVELFGTNATSNRTVNFPDASGVVGLSAAALTTGSIVFAGAGGVLSESNATLFWDNTNKRLGIGNASPGAPLDIHGTGTAAQFNGTGTNNAYVFFQNAGTSKWRIGNLYSAGANNFELHNAATATTALSFNGTTSKPTFNTGINATGLDDQMLQVYGGSPSIRLFNTITSPTINGFVGMSTATNNFILGSASGDMCIGTSTAGKIYIGSGTTTVSPAMTISNTGDVCIGKATYDNTTPGISLTSIANGPLGSFVASSANVLLLNRQTTTGTIVTIRYNNATVGSISTDGTTTAYNITSDYRLKEDFIATKGLEKVCAIKIYDFKFKNSENRMDGVIAHELQKIIPYAVIGKKDAINEEGEIEAQGVDYSKLVPILVKAIQELNDKLVKNNIN